MGAWVDAPAPPWHSAGTVIDTSYEALDTMARRPAPQGASANRARLDRAPAVEPGVTVIPPDAFGVTAPDAAAVAARDVWLVHPWNLGALPDALPPDMRVIGVFVSDFHRAWPWSERRWDFVGRRMAELAAVCWYGDAAAIGAALLAARTVCSIDEPHLAPCLAGWAACEAAPALFPSIDRRCDSFSQWWSRASRGLRSAEDLLAVHGAPAP